jgi:hypothetical protein
MLSIAPSAGVDVGQAYLDLGFFPSAKPIRPFAFGQPATANGAKGPDRPGDLTPGVRVSDVARRYGICAQQLTAWRRAARSGLAANGAP